MVTTESTFTPPEAHTSERDTSREKLAHEKLRRELAAITLLAILIATYQNKENDHLFAEQESPQDEPATDRRAEIFSLVNHSFNESPSRTIDGGDTPFGSNNVFLNNIAHYRDSIFSQPQRPAPPEFRPAPSMAPTELGPQLPNLAFNDRIRPENTGSKSASDADFAAADRANDMYQRALFDKGWRGGEATPDEQTRAARGVARKYHPDYPTTSKADADAVKMFNANHARPTTPGQEGPGSSPTPSPE